MTNFNNLKNWLKNNNIYFEKGYSAYDENEEVHDFVIIPSAFAQVYNDESGLTFDYGNNSFETFQDNKELYKVIKEEIGKDRN
ncbi:hypothetical protein NUT40_02760 [Staphylococcus saprophyticus]|nr:hypothetical protein NUT40_02760 [Staphylococcus saprophyticus]